MGEEDIRRQKLNVFNMRTLGAKVVPVTTGSRTLRDATNEAMRDWMGSSIADALHDRQRRRSAPVPDDRPRLPGGHRQRDPTAMPRSDRPVARLGRRLRRGRVERGGDVLSVRRRCRGRTDRRRGRRPGSDGRRARLEPHTGPSRRPARQLQLRAPGRRRPDRGRPLDLRGTRLSRRRTRSTATGRTPAASATRASPTSRRSTHITPWHATKGSSPHSSRATPSPRPSRKPRGLARARSSSSASPAAATRTPTRWLASAASRL